MLHQGADRTKFEPPAQPLIRHLGDGWITIAKKRNKPVAIPWPAPERTQFLPRLIDAGGQRSLLDDRKSFLEKFYTEHGTRSNLQANQWSAFYPMMGTYEVLIPAEAMEDPAFELVIVLQGRSVQSATKAARR